ncbi:PE-PGRS family protein [Streptomyces sp. CA-294286]|uniref:PE-PGRS family protein n=1 Tax=Streptomyces sp. CA-294286 TaxID=3240070 RepID=UPI003D8F69BB
MSILRWRPNQRRRNDFPWHGGLREDDEDLPPGWPYAASDEPEPWDPGEPWGPAPDERAWSPGPPSRHTELTDPVLSVRTLGRYEYATKRLPVGADHALVFATTDHHYRSFVPPARPTRADIASGRFTAVYEVDMGVQRASKELELPSDQESFSFVAEADFEWRVTDPAAFVVSGERDVPELLHRALVRTLRPVAAAHPVHRARDAERSARAALGLAGPLGAGQGITVRCDIRLSVDEPTARHAAAVRERHQAHDLAVLREEHERALRHYRDQKIAYYQEHLRRGGVTAWAFHLAEHPEDALLAVQNLSHEQRELVRSQYAVAKELVTGPGVEAYQMEGPKKRLLQFLEDAFAQARPEALGPLPEPEKPAPEESP